MGSASFFIHQLSDSNVEEITFAKSVVNKWWITHHERQLTQVHSIIKQCETDSHFTFHLPNRIIEEESLKYIVIGVDRLDLNNFEDVLNLLGRLIGFLDTDINFFTFVNIHKNKAINAFRVQKEFFGKIKTVLNGGEFENSEYGNPLPIEVDEELLKSLEGVNFKPISIGKKYEYFTMMMFDVWKLGEYRKRLNNENEIEKQWLEEIEQVYIKKINDNLNQIKLKDDFNRFQSYRVLIDQFVNNKIKISTSEIVDNLNKSMSDSNLEIYKKNT